MSECADQFQIDISDVDVQSGSDANRPESCPGCDQSVVFGAHCCRGCGEILFSRMSKLARDLQFCAGTLPSVRTGTRITEHLLRRQIRALSQRQPFGHCRRWPTDECQAAMSRLPVARPRERRISARQCAQWATSNYQPRQRQEIEVMRAHCLLTTPRPELSFA